MSEITDLGECDIVLTRQQPNFAAAGDRLVLQAHCARANARERFETARSTALGSAPSTMSAEDVVLIVHRLKTDCEKILTELNAAIDSIKVELAQLQRLSKRKRID